MPNHVTNRIVVTGPSAAIAAFRAAFLVEDVETDEDGREHRFTGLAVLLQSNDLKQALRSYCVGGPYGRLLDAEAEHLGSSDVQAYEIEGLVGTGAAPAVLAYLFHRIGDRLDGRPTLLIIDEGWLALDDDGF